MPTKTYEYPHQIGWYAKKMGVHLRTARTYMEIGREAGKMPPLDTPAELTEWWEVHMKTPMPPGVLAFASGAPAAKKATKVAQVDFEFAGPGGFEDSVRELRMTVRAGQARLRRAMTADIINEGLVISCNRAVKEGLDLLRKAENDLLAMQDRKGDLVLRREVTEDWRTLLAAMRQMRRRMIDNVAAAMAKSGEFTPAQIESAKTLIGGEREREDQLLRGAKHWREAESIDAVA